MKSHCASAIEVADVMPAVVPPAPHSAALQQQFYQIRPSCPSHWGFLSRVLLWGMCSDVLPPSDTLLM